MLAEAPGLGPGEHVCGKWLADLPDLAPALLLRQQKQLGSQARRAGQGLRAQGGQVLGSAPWYQTAALY